MSFNQDAFLLKADFAPLTVLKLKNNNLTLFQKQLQQTIEHAPNYLKQAAVVIDVNDLHEAESLDLKTLHEHLVSANIVPVGIRGLDEAQHTLARSFNIAPLKNSQAKDTSTNNNKTTHRSTKVIDQAIRSGQQVYAKDSDLIIMAPVNAGAEIVADGNISVYGPLRGRVLAGAGGDTTANIFCYQCEAELLSIAGNYIVKEHIKIPETDKPILRISLKNQHINIEGI